jgi:spermidine synthase
VLQGALVGLEIPLIVRTLRRRVLFQDLIARALAFDYLGALLAGVLFTLVLLPRLGLTRVGIVFGIVNALVALASTWIFASSLTHHSRLRARSLAVLGVLAIALLFSQKMTSVTESWLYADPVVYARQTQFQRIVLTAGRGGHNLFLDGALQFSSHDEYRYHEALVHPVLAQSAAPARVLVLGGGDGLAVREVVRHQHVRDVTLVDIDPGITDLARHNPVLAHINQHALEDGRVTVINDDAMAWLAEGDDVFDAVVIDFPDPNNYTLGKLYTTGFYRRVLRRLHERGALVVQATSPLVARQSFWCIVSTLEAVGLHTLPYHAPVPSFGEWGYVLASRTPPAIPERLPSGLRYLDATVLPGLFVFPLDMQRVQADVNRLSSQVLVRYYEEEWRQLL